jgi:hypothetical protein
MDPLSITAATLAIIGGISKTYNIIKDLKGLPKAFKEVGENLNLVKETLDLAHAQFQADNIKVSVQKAINPILAECHDKAELLKKIFKQIEAKMGSDEDTKEWATLIGWYRKALRMSKANRVEELMKGILEGLEVLATFQIFNTAAQATAQTEKLELAIKKLAEVDPSLSDSDPEAGGDDFKLIVNGERATGNLYSNKYGEMVVGTQFRNEKGDMKFGTDYLALLEKKEEKRKDN